MSDPLSTDGEARQVGEHLCPYCGRPNDALVFAGSVETGGIGDGDLSICWGCRRPAMIRMSPLGVITIVAMTPAEEREAARSPELRDLLATLEVGRTPIDAARTTRKRFT